MGVVYTFVNGQKKYLYLPSIEKPYYLCYTDSAIDTTSPLVRTFYKVYLDGTSTDETFNYTFRTNKGTTKPYFSGTRYDKDYRRMIIWHTDATSMTETCNLYFDIFNMGDMSLAKSFSCPFEYPCSYTSSTYNNDKHLLLTLGSGMYYNGTEWTKNSRQLRIIDLVNLKMLTKTFVWPNGYISTILGSYYIKSTNKLRIMFKNYYDPYSTTVSAGGVFVYEVNLTDDEYDIQPIFSKIFNTQTGTLALSYAQTIGYTLPNYYDSKFIILDPCSGTATINSKTRAVSNKFFTYDYVNNTMSEVSHTQSHCVSNPTGIVSSDMYGTTGFFVKYLDLAKTDTTIFAVRGATVSTYNSRIGQRWTNAQNISSWYKDLCVYTSASDSTAGVGKVVFYSSRIYSDGPGYYMPPIYEAVSGNTISSTATGSMSTLQSYQYLIISKKEDTSGILRYVNLWDKDGIYGNVYNNQTYKLDLFTNTAIANLGSSPTLSNLIIY